jgi:hypothetical protein
VRNIDGLKMLGRCEDSLGDLVRSIWAVWQREFGQFVRKKLGGLAEGVWTVCKEETGRFGKGDLDSLVGRN